MGRNREQWSTPARVTAAVSVVVAALLAITSIAAADERRSLVAMLALGGAVALAAGIAARGPVIVWVAVALAGAAGALADAPSPPLFAVGLFVAAEGAFWSHEERFARVEDPGVHRDRLLVLGAIATTSLLVGAAMRLLARDETTRESGYTVVAAVATVALVLLLVLRARVTVRRASGGS